MRAGPNSNPNWPSEPPAWNVALFLIRLRPLPSNVGLKWHPKSPWVCASCASFRSGWNIEDV